MVKVTGLMVVVWNSSRSGRTTEFPNLEEVSAVQRLLHDPCEEGRRTGHCHWRRCIRVAFDDRNRHHRAGLRVRHRSSPPCARPTTRAPRRARNALLTFLHDLDGGKWGVVAQGEKRHRKLLVDGMAGRASRFSRRACSVGQRDA